MIVRPGAELEGTVLLVEREVLDLNLTGTFVNGWGKPLDGSIEEDDSVGEDCDLVSTISTMRKRVNTLGLVKQDLTLQQQTGNHAPGQQLDMSVTRNTFTTTDSSVYCWRKLENSVISFLDQTCS